MSSSNAYGLHFHYTVFFLPACTMVSLERVPYDQITEEEKTQVQFTDGSEQHADT